MVRLGGRSVGLQPRSILVIAAEEIEVPEIARNLPRMVNRRGAAGRQCVAEPLAVPGDSAAASFGSSR
jgi:hypothetical protein